jgi:hypothetical protein
MNKFSLLHTITIYVIKRSKSLKVIFAKIKFILLPLIGCQKVFFLKTFLFDSIFLFFKNQVKTLSLSARPGPPVEPVPPVGASLPGRT